MASVKHQFSLTHSTRAKPSCSHPAASSLTFSSFVQAHRTARKRRYVLLKYSAACLLVTYLLAIRVVFNFDFLKATGNETGKVSSSVLSSNSTMIGVSHSEPYDEEIAINGRLIGFIKRFKLRDHIPSAHKIRAGNNAWRRLARLPFWQLGLESWIRRPSVALCLVGAARDFHLTGPSIVSNLIQAYPDGDVFLVSPLDEHSHRLSLLQVASHQIAWIRIVPDVPVNETDVTDSVLRSVRTGPEYVPRQQLIQQFKSIEMCAEMVVEYEKRKNIKYQRVLRTRVDGFWTQKSPNLESIDQNVYTIPDGADWGGVNDRLGVGPREMGLKALRRLSVLAELAGAGYRELNAEKVYRAHLDYLNVKFSQYSFPFCILSRKKTYSGIPVAASISSVAALNGAKCRPCKKYMTGNESEAYILQLPRKKVFGPDNKGVDLCPAEDGWEPGWESFFDRDVGDDYASVRKYFDSRTFDDCVSDWNRLKFVAKTWDGPPADVLCTRSLLGKVQRVGFPGGDWPVFLDVLNENSVVYSMASGDTYSWDHQMMRVKKVAIHSFDGTPYGLRWIADHFDEMKPSFHHHPWMLLDTKTPVQVYAIDSVDRPLEYSLKLPEHLVLDSVPPSIQIESKSIFATMAELRHDHIDVLRLGGHRTLHEAIFDKWILDGQTPRVCQVIVSFHMDDKHFANPNAARSLLALRRLGLELAICIPRGAYIDERVYESCLFFSTKHCRSLL